MVHKETNTCIVTLGTSRPQPSSPTRLQPQQTPELQSMSDKRETRNAVILGQWVLECIYKTPHTLKYKYQVRVKGFKKKKGILSKWTQEAIRQCYFNI